MQTTLEIGDGYGLTELRRGDVAAIVEYAGDRDIHDRTLRIPYPYTTTHAEQWLESIEHATIQRGRVLVFAVREPAGKLIGSIGIEPAPTTEGQTAPATAEIGYWLAKPYWGRGIMPRAVTSICRYAFEVLNPATITAHVFVFNDASARVLEKCGFRDEGILPDHGLKNDRLIDARRFVLDRPVAPGLG